MNDQNKLMHLPTFLDTITTIISTSAWKKGIMSKPLSKNSEVQKITLSPVVIKGHQRVKWVFSYATQDITKHCSPEESTVWLEEQLGSHFMIAEVWADGRQILYRRNSKGHDIITEKKSAAMTTTPNTQGHDRIKAHTILEDRPYLHLLGLSNERGKVYDKARKKFVQIHRYIELLSPYFEDNVEKKWHIVDMGSGKGYLTFALYDYLIQKYGTSRISILGYDIRDNLINQCNNIAAECQYTNLHFRMGNIENVDIQMANVLIALHACDIATDMAICNAIEQKVDIVAVAPCCHKEVRHSLEIPEAHFFLKQHGLFLERHAELITDAIRSLVLQAYGYSVKVMEFVALEHTPKNVLIVGKRTQSFDHVAKKKVFDMMAQFGIKKHYLVDKLWPKKES